MGWTFTPLDGHVTFQYDGTETPVCADGNNVAWVCTCGEPLLFVYLQGRKGSALESPRACVCGAAYYLIPSVGFQQEPPEKVPPAETMVITLANG